MSEIPDAVLADLDAISPSEESEYIVLYFHSGTPQVSGPYDDEPTAIRIAKTKFGGFVMKRTNTISYGPWHSVES